MKPKMVPRCVLDIICKLLEIIPNSETKLINEITSYSKSLWNKAPEILRSSEAWGPLQLILSTNITIIDTEWKKELIILFNG